jgi:DNA modification methylase
LIEPLELPADYLTNKNKAFVTQFEQVKSKAKDKLHPWGQSPGVWQWVDSLTNPRELVVDPFCGYGEWGWTCGTMGRRWIGSDIADGGSTRIAG